MTIALLSFTAGLDILPPALKGRMNYGAMMIRPNIALVSADTPDEILRNSLFGHSDRIAIGPREVWERFPEYQEEFYVSVYRATRRGRERLDIPLRMTAVGDILEKPEVRLVDQMRMHRLPMEFRFEAMPLPQDMAARFGYLINVPVAKRISVLERDIYFCDGFSLHGDSELLRGVDFADPLTLFHNSDFEELCAKNVDPTFLGGMPYIPDRCTGAIVVARPEPGALEYSAATVNRILAAATIGAHSSGKILSKLYLHTGGYSAQTYSSSRWRRPYQDQHIPPTVTARCDAPILSDVLTLMSGSSLPKFKQGKEDFRLLALDTVEDSREHPVPALQFVQLWMALERLLPYRTETTANISLSLSAFAPAAERLDFYEKMKDLYKLRSSVAHGYSFRRDGTIQTNIACLAELFRTVFKASLPFPDIDSYRSALVRHVLTGCPESFSCVAATQMTRDC